MPGGIEESNVQKPGDLVVGRGGIGNLEQHRIWQELPEEYPPRQAEPDANQVHSTGRGGTGNLKAGLPDGLAVDKLSTTPKDSDVLSYGRGGFGNIGAAKSAQKRVEEEKARQNALMLQKARAEAFAETIQLPKPTRVHMRD